jgi:outer membrane receptor protein involved in Fe transport
MLLEGGSSVVPAVVAMALAAQAQPVGQPPDTGEIIVTGERVKRSLKETPSSVAVFDKRDIERMAAPDRIQDVLALVPNVLLTERRDPPTIRGQGSAGVLAGLPAFLGGARPRTVLQIDGRTVTFNEFSNSTEGLWDVDRVEVFLSPQTTTQGANSIGGAIFITTADPTYRLEGKARVVGGEWHRRQLSAALSVPLLDDQLAVRVSGDLYRSLSADKLTGPVVGISNLNEDHYEVLRAKLLAEPHALPGLRILVTASHVRSRAPQILGATFPYRERRDENYFAGYPKATVNSLTSTITYRITPALESRTTLAWGDTRFRRFAPQGFGQNRTHGRDRSLESILEWKPEQPVSLVGGVSFLEMKVDQFIDLTATPLGTGSFKDRQPSLGLFGEANWHPAPRLTLTAGIRYQSDRKKRTGALGTVPQLPIDYDETDHAVLPKISGAYDLTDDLRVGVLVQRAYNPGGVTLDPAHAAEVRFGPEYLWDYEVYTRASFLGGSLSIVGNLFYNDMRDAQRILGFCIPSPNGCVEVAQVANAPRAHSYGAELETRYKVSDRLSLSSAIGLLGTKITKTLAPDDPILGKRFGTSPSFTATAAVDWEPVRHVHLSSQVHHDSGYGDDVESEFERIKPATTVDARASWETRRFTAFAFARNLFDQFRITYWGGPHDSRDLEVGTNDPREIGVGIEARF